MISDSETLRIAERWEHADDIDIKETIEKATNAGYLGEKHFYCTAIEEGGFTYTVPEILGDRYKSIPLDNLYYDIISKSLDFDGIYISLGYCASHIRVADEKCDEIIEYDDYDLEDDEYEYMMEYVLITSDCLKKFKVYAEEGISGHDPTEDVGLIVNIIDGEYKAYFGLRSTDLCMSSFKVMPFSDRYPKEHPLSFRNPINKILIEMIDRTIVLKK
jgi:hypothetical protein